MQWRSSQFLAAVDEISGESRDSGLCDGTGAENVIKTNWVPTYDHSGHGGVSICQSLSLSFNTESTSSALLAFKCSTLGSVCGGCEFMGNTIGLLHIMTLQFFERILNSQLFEWNVCMYVYLLSVCPIMCKDRALSCTQQIPWSSKSHVNKICRAVCCLLQLYRVYIKKVCYSCSQPSQPPKQSASEHFTACMQASASLDTFQSFTWLLNLSSVSGFYVNTLSNGVQVEIKRKTKS